MGGQDAEQAGPGTEDPTAPTDPAMLLRDRKYIALLLMGAVIGVPVAAVSYGFLELVSRAQEYLYETAPGDLGFDAQPDWWPLPILAVGGLGVAVAIRFLPGTAGHRPAAGFVAGGPVEPVELAGITLAAFATLASGAVLGPEAPLIAIGSGLGVLAVRSLARGAPQQAVVIIGSAGSFAAVSTLLGSPLAAAFLLMEAAGLAGALTSVVLLPGLVAAGTGALVFVGLNAWTGWGTFSLGLDALPPATAPTLAEFGWALVIGVLAAVAGRSIRLGAVRLQGMVDRAPLVLTPGMGLVAGLSTWLYVSTTGHDPADVLFSGQDQLGPLVTGSAAWTVGALVLLFACKGLAYATALSCFRGGPVFPGMFLGAVGGIALAHLPGLSTVQGAAMGIGAMCVAMLGLPLVSVLLVAMFFQADGLALMPTVIVAVAVAHVVSAQLTPLPAHEVTPGVAEATA